MREPGDRDPRLDRAALGDDEMLSSHEELLGARRDERARYRIVPLAVLLVMSGCILFADLREMSV